MTYIFIVPLWFHESNAYTLKEK